MRLRKVSTLKENLWGEELLSTDIFAEWMWEARGSAVQGKTGL